MKMRVLLTGGGGMVGKNFLDHPNIDDFEILAPRSSELNLLDFDQVKGYVVKNRPDLVIHAAGKVAGIQENINNPVPFLVENLDMGRNVVMASFEVGVPRLLNLGSSCMYPRNVSVALTEDMLLKGELEPTNEGYALAKIATAKLCEFISRQSDLFKFKTIIPCNLYGRYDKFDPTHSHLVPAIIHKLHQAKIKGDQDVEIWGDGTARREFMYAGDLADFLYRSVNNFDEIPVYMNVGNGFDFTIDDYYKIAASVIGYKGRFIYNPDRPVGMARKLVNLDRAANWGWKSTTSLEDGLVRTYNYYLESLYVE
jgi:GDP-L-fucose synthase